VPGLFCVFQKFLVLSNIMALIYDLKSNFQGIFKPIGDWLAGHGTDSIAASIKVKT